MKRDCPKSRGGYRGDSGDINDRKYRERDDDRYERKNREYKN